MLYPAVEIDMFTYRQRLTILILVTVSSITGMMFLNRIPQDPSYHFFADTRNIGSVKNSLNVLSNIVFILAGLYGLWQRKLLKNAEDGNSYTAFCIAVIFVGFGSAYYHCAPSTPSLFWDRLPMTMAFMAFFSMLLEERVIPLKSRTLLPLMAIGFGAAAYWRWTESMGIGDLRPYALVQYLTIALIPLILLLFHSRYLNSSLIWSALALYATAKVLEHFDKQLLDMTGILSGHTIKHILAGLAILCIMFSATGRRNNAEPRSGDIQS